jgi:hypothetical protein
MKIMYFSTHIDDIIAFYMLRFWTEGKWYIRLCE